MFSGSRGSGTVFFSGCNLGCLFCQNYDISARQKGQLCDSSALAELFLKLQEQGAHNINLVTPTPHVEVIREAIVRAKEQGLILPILYNTNGYELVEVLRSLEGLIDIYLPDLKYVDPALSKRLSGAADYFSFAEKALEEMYRQVGPLMLDEDGIAKKGVLTRHLVLPGCVTDTCRVLDHIHDTYGKNMYVSLMRQYAPAGCLEKLPKVLQRPLTDREYQTAVDHCRMLGMQAVLLQEKEAADRAFTPPFFECLAEE